MAVDHGMNTESVVALSTAATTFAADLERISGELNSEINGTAWGAWLGPDATRFRDQWRRNDYPFLKRTADSFRSLHDHLNTNINEQARASADGGGSSGYGQTPSYPFQMRTLDFGLGDVSFGAGAWFALMAGYVGKTYEIGDFVQSKLGVLVQAGKYGELVEKYPSFALMMARFGIDGPSKSYSSVTGKLALPKVIGKAFDIISVAKSGFKLGGAIASGDVDGGLRAGIDVSWTIAGAAFPPVGLAKGAWDGGFAIGTFAAHEFHISDHVSASILDNVTRSMGGVDNLTIAQGTEIGKRYDGVGGFVNFAGDGAKAALHGVFGRIQL